MLRFKEMDKNCYSATVAKVQVSASPGDSQQSGQGPAGRMSVSPHSGRTFAYICKETILFLKLEKNILNNAHVYYIYLEIFVIQKCSSLSCEAGVCGVCLCADVWSPLPAFTLAASASSPLARAGQVTLHCSTWQHPPSCQPAAGNRTWHCYGQVPVITKPVMSCVLSVIQTVHVQSSLILSCQPF